MSIHCNIANNFYDNNGTYHIQHACGGSTAPWGYNINSATCATAATWVHEAGMYWARNGATQPLQAAHDEPCNYTFHGTYNPVFDYDHVAYSDVFTWGTPNGGRAQLQIYGSFTASGSPCSPTSC